MGSGAIHTLKKDTHTYTEKNSYLSTFGQHTNEVEEANNNNNNNKKQVGKGGREGRKEMHGPDERGIGRALEGYKDKQAR